MMMMNILMILIMMMIMRSVVRLAMAEDDLGPASDWRRGSTVAQVMMMMMIMMIMMIVMMMMMMPRARTLSWSPSSRTSGPTSSAGSLASPSWTPWRPTSARSFSL